MKIRSLLKLSIVATVGLVFLSGCESDEDNAILKAQECFNKVNQTSVDSPAADACLSHISSISSPEASLLKCGIEFYKGGLTSTKMVDAFDEYDDQPENQKEAYLMSELSLSSSGTANAAYNYCKLAESPGMLYIATLIKLGTLMTLAGAGITPADIVDDCIADTASCATAENGQMIIDVASVYCIGESATDDVCVAMNSAILANPGDPAAVIQQFLSQINF